MQTSADIQLLQEQIALESQVIERLLVETNKVIIGQQYMLERLMIGLLAQGHILLEGLPGLAKTLAINTLSKAISADFQRIQFTPDLLPADIIGTMIYNQAENDFTVRKGPIFANFILADEINRAPAKVQSALLEAMQERQVTIGEISYKLQEPFLVLATQNPIEQEGTYPLPEAQTDRFMLKASITYPNKEDERAIMRMNMAGSFEKINPVATIQDILLARETVRKVHMAESIEQYILDIVFATREPSEHGLSEIAPLISFGGSPRASINMALAAKAHAYMRKRAFVIPEDIRAIAQDVLRHRIGLTYEAQAESITTEQIIEKILNTVQIP
ncbi:MULTISPECIES: MoxR family ATPase [unclassified Aureispira]|uniref:AAA family ATPase n=1 Tax=unclassified Aureispira TaxID=2649989 RepID=UPI000697DA40|nr:MULTISPECIES: MoxR family ATPase [unclassified Aureispira]WMX15342.1 MoxR family ATPase [Aureispira sp. CCB-E]